MSTSRIGINDLATNLDFLIEYGCPSIAFRTRLEILKEDGDSEVLRGLYEEIKADPGVLHVLGLQREDGWIGTRFHTAESHDQFTGTEISTRYLFEKGFKPDDAAMTEVRKALYRVFSDDSSRNNTDNTPASFTHYDETSGNYGGFRTILASLLVRFLDEDNEYVKTETESALLAFRQVLKYSKLSDIAYPLKGKLYFHEDLAWPCIYHLRLLAHSKGWRTRENLAMIAVSLNKLSEILPLANQIYIRKNKKIYAPAQAFVSDFMPDIDKPLENMDFFWFDRMELYARLGVVRGVPVLSNQLDKMKSTLRKSGGIFKPDRVSSNFKAWNAYHGLMLEPSHKRKESRWADSTFRCALIEHYSNKTLGE
ncbi:MAG TPA: hypothetical protein PKV16_05250 [Caldisericia bacterium]|nr:hypothetical protein [Caldisericia bacterium]HPI83620.1 hypothetical protein [Caldisericia bacterium]HPQ93175.1 hypothetical protein [Caldisericia bacterium]